MNVHKLGLLVLVCACLVSLAGCAPPVPQAAPAAATPLPPTATSLPASPTPLPPAATPVPAEVEMPEILKAYVEAFNEHDADAVMDLFVDEGLDFLDVNFFETRNKADLRGYIEFQMGTGGVVKIEDCALQGETWQCTLLAHDDCAEAVNVVDAHNDLRVRISDDKIQDMQITIDPNEYRTFSTVEWPKLHGWAQANRPSDWQKFSTGGYSRENGELWSQVCKEYAATLAPAATPAPAATEMPEILKAYVEAFNEGDADAVMDLFVDEGLVFVDMYALTTSAKATLRGYIEHQIGLGGVQRIEGCKLDGETWHCTLLAHDDCAPALGVVDSHNDLRVRLGDGKIKEMLITVDADDWRLFTTELLPKFQAWGQANRPDDWKKMTSGTYSREIGELISEVCKEYGASKN